MDNPHRHHFRSYKVKPIYVVSGVPRCGSTCGMGCMIAGGLTVVFSGSRGELNTANSSMGYVPNPTNLYECSINRMREIDWPRQYPGCCVKALGLSTQLLAVYQPGYRVVMMKRDPEEMRQSGEGAFGRAMKRTIEDIERHWMNAYEQLTNRKDVIDVQVVEYLDLLYTPVSTLSRLNWPIDVEKAATVPDEQYYRFRKDVLVAGL